MKRTFDFSVAVIILIILSLPLIILMVIVRIKLGNPIFFKQTRPGLNTKPFTIIKFRTMTEQCDPNGLLLSDALRLTRFGQFLRASSLDELPELLNILKGEMSLVGPRPLLMEYLPFYTPEQLRRHEVRPGLTGWAQINGRNAISWDEKFELDLWYVDNHNLWIDIKIILKTIVIVFQRKQICADGHVTMPPFIDF
ncbi:sugar transferase [Polynucleobacter sp. MWH-UH24A]|uniref:sugar transferase n=1 Tax=Polynucleobacter sp. MWH-UH24A TaxID=2689110 RepID=UPI001BFE1608|nr:sugar transferase [Polynucleobacter sp. MWH-UH24A]QWD76439.1 sugar transferase [Polynucleobacter sp. MWH-UH24A]